MSGNRYLLDTNAIILLLQGNQHLVALLDQARWVGISVISKLEFLAFTGLSFADRELYAKFETRVDVVGVLADDRHLLDTIVAFRVSSGLKLPDAIIAASATSRGACLITADQHFRSVASLEVECI